MLQRNLGELDIVLPVIFILVIVNSTLTVVSHMQEDVAFKYHPQEGGVGVAICVVRIIMWGWFSWGVSTTRQAAPSKMGVFFSKFWVTGTFYFLSYPALWLIMGLFAAYLRHKFMVHTCVFETGLII